MKNKPLALSRACARALSAVFLLCAITSGLFAQAVRDGAHDGAGARDSLNAETQLPLKRVVILTSGLAYYEHSGEINGPVRITLPFRPDAVNDALK